MSICILTHSQVKQWESSRIKPQCKFHSHITYTKALVEIEQDDAFPVVGLRAIVRFPCVERYHWQGRMSGACKVLQLVPIKI